MTNPKSEIRSRARETPRGQGGNPKQIRKWQGGKWGMFRVVFADSIFVLVSNFDIRISDF
jgi:hypothetical protein